jgi:hypothetical protein
MIKLKNRSGTISSKISVPAFSLLFPANITGYRLSKLNDIIEALAISGRQRKPTNTKSRLLEV